MSKKSKSNLSEAEHAFIKQVTAFADCIMNHGQGLSRGRGAREKTEHEMFLFMLHRLIKFSRKIHPELFKGIKDEVVEPTVKKP